MFTDYLTTSKIYTKRLVRITIVADLLVTVILKHFKIKYNKNNMIKTGYAGYDKQKLKKL